MDRNFPRLLDTLTVLQRRGGLTTQQVCAALEARGHTVSVRTVQRDLEALAGVYPLTCDQRTRPYVWRWEPTAPRISIPGMDWPEAIGFHMLSKYLDALLPSGVRTSIEPYVTEADRRLAAHFENLPLRRWPERVRMLPAGQVFIAPVVPISVHLAFTEAVLLGRRVRMRYRAFDQAQARRFDVAPLGLVQRGAALYVPARFDGHDDVRTLALHRVQRAEVLEAPSGVENFDLSAWLRDGGLGFGGAQRIALVLRTHCNTGQLLAEAPLSVNQVMEPPVNGVQIVRAEVLDTAELRRWLLSMSSRIAVLEPPTLRQALADEVHAAAALYDFSPRS